MCTYKIADLIVRMETFGKTKDLAEPYLTEKEESVADITIRGRGHELYERNPTISLDDCEYITTGCSFYRKIAYFGGAMLHSSCVVVDDKAYLFSAPCGTGKSTHTQNWLRLFGEAAYILNDDKPALRLIDNQIFVYGTPWCGKDGINRNVRVPLGGIAIINRAEENSIFAMPPTKVLFALFDQTYRCISEARLIDTTALIEAIALSGKVYELFCNMDISAARLSYETMSGKRILT